MRNGIARTTGGRINCDRKKKEMSLFRHGPNLYSNRLSPYAASEPITTASADAPIEAMTLLRNLFKNSSRTLECAKMVSGERPSDCHPFQLGTKSSQGTRWPCVTSLPSLKDVDNVQ